ncbi:MAG: SOS response-associated peptidase [Pseudomonadota bacterium]
MCSRYMLTSPAEAVRAHFAHHNEVAFPPRANIAPTQPIGIIRLTPKLERSFELVRWGLIPPWVKDPKAFTTLINARSETAFEKPSFRAAMKYRRCLIPTDGFYEWTGPKGAKQPHLITRQTNAPFAFAGIFEQWMGADGSEMDSAAILTTAANPAVEAIHDRMPVLLHEADFETWLDPGLNDKAGRAALEPLLKPWPQDDLTITAVDPAINRSRDSDAQPVPLQRKLI